jgi:hypothetical protein
MPADSTSTKRPAPKSRIPKEVKAIADEISTGFGELKRQSGAAVANVKAGVQKIKDSLKR